MSFFPVSPSYLSLFYSIFIPKIGTILSTGFIFGLNSDHRAWLMTTQWRDHFSLFSQRFRHTCRGFYPTFQGEIFVGNSILDRMDHEDEVQETENGHWAYLDGTPASQPDDDDLQVSQPGILVRTVFPVLFGKKKMKKEFFFVSNRVKDGICWRIWCRWGGCSIGGAHSSSSSSGLFSNSRRVGSTIVEITPFHSQTTLNAVGCHRPRMAGRRNANGRGISWRASGRGRTICHLTWSLRRMNGPRGRRRRFRRPRRLIWQRTTIRMMIWRGRVHRGDGKCRMRGDRWWQVSKSTASFRALLEFFLVGLQFFLATNIRQNISIQYFFFWYLYGMFFFIRIDFFKDLILMCNWSIDWLIDWIHYESRNGAIEIHRVDSRIN